MKRLKVIIIFLIVIIGSLFILLISINNRQEISKSKNSDEYLKDEETEEIKYEDKQKVDNSVDFYTVSECIFEYNKNKDENFINCYVINVLQYTEESLNITNYAVKSLNVEQNNVNYEFYKVKMNYKDCVYEIERIDCQDIEDINIKDNNEIEENKTKNYTYCFKDDEEIAEYKYETLKYQLMYDTDNFYNLLESEYKTKKFNNEINNYKRYVSDNIEKLKNSILLKYKVDENDDIIEYIMENEYKNQYIIFVNKNEISKVRLDNYTILTENYIEDYNSLDNSSKAHTNVDIFLKMINSKDYKQAYEKLEETEKNGHLDSLDKFREYIENNFYETNYLYVNYVEEIEDGRFLVNTTLKSDISSAADSMEKNFIVKLNEGTDFVISFEI